MQVYENKQKGAIKSIKDSDARFDQERKLFETRIMEFKEPVDGKQKYSEEERKRRRQEEEKIRNEFD